MDNDLQFDQVQRPAGASACTGCQTPLTDSYYQANGRLLCARCAEGMRNYFYSKDGGIERFLKATVFGIGGGIAGGAIYTAVLVLAKINLALITILIGWMVGKTVRQGSGGRGGIGYQILAVAITYLTIGLSLTLMPFFSGHGGQYGFVETILICIIGSFTAPIEDATESIFGAIITIFGLLQAWKLNKPVQVAITGPHALVTVRPVAPIRAEPPIPRPFPTALPPSPPSA